MNIKKIIAKNFYSYEHLELDLSNKNGVILVEGLDKDTGGSNGSGKSVIVEAVCYGLTGKTIRKSTEKSMIRHGANSCLVEIYLDDNVVIRRGRKPTLLEFIVDGEKKVGPTTDDTQDLINNHYNTNLKILLTSMFFGQSNNLTFLDATAEDKRNIIRSFLDLEDVFSYRENIKKIKSDCSAQSRANKAVLGKLEATVKKIEADIEFLKDDDVPLAIARLEELPTEEELITQWNEWWTCQAEALARATNIKSIEEELDDWRSNRCPSCKQTIKNDTDVLQKCHELSLEKEEYNIGEASMLQVEKPPISLGDYRPLLNIKMEWDAKQAQAEWYKDRISDANGSMGKCEEEIVEADSLYGVMRFWERAFSEKGMVKYIIGNILEFFNKRVACYLSYLTNSRIFLEFNRELEEIIHISDKEIPYISLSGGEKKKVNLAVLLALKDLLLFTNKTQSNLIIFDEVTNSLDEEGVIGLYQLLREIKKDKSVIIITHNKYLKNLLDSSNVITVTKEKGISSIHVN